MISDEMRKLLTKYGQEHILDFYDELNAEEQKSLENQIAQIDFDCIRQLYLQTQHAEITENNSIEPIPCAVKADLSKEVHDRYYQKGIEAMRQGKYAAVTMAGGQGTRLGHDGPKGTFDIGLPEKLSLFEIQCRRLSARSRECGRTIPWYIMTSTENDAATKAFFQEHQYFGYPRQEIRFFTQFMLPMIDRTGKIVMDEKYRIKEGADGHGGIFKAMLKHGIIDDMKQRGIEWIFTGGIDNVLVRLEDPCFVGYLIENGFELGGKSIIKRDAYEKAGVFCKKNHKPFVVEYTEISSEMAELKDQNGDFVYGDAHILCNIFNIHVFENMGAEGLPHHVAHKKTDFVNKNGIKITPQQPNAYKFEAFIFDAFAFYRDMGIFRVRREEEFAPVKNKTGEDSPDTARALYIADVNSIGKG